MVNIKNKANNKEKLIEFFINKKNDFLVIKKFKNTKKL